MLTNKQQTILYEYYKPMVLRLIHSKRSTHFDYDIICNNVFLSVFKNIDQYAGSYIRHHQLDCNVSPSFESWIYKITQRHIVSYFRTIKIYSKNIVLTDKPYDMAIPENIEYEHNNTIQVILSQLPKITRNVFEEYIEGYTYKELQEKYNMAYGTVKWHVCDARRYVKVKYNILGWAHNFSIPKYRFVQS